MHRTNIRHALGLFAVLAARGGAAFGGIWLSLLIARHAGPEGLGRFAIFLSFLGAFAILARRGQDMLMIRAVAKAMYQGATEIPFLLLAHGTKSVLVMALMLCVPGALLLGSGWFGNTVQNGPYAFLICLPMMSLLAVISGYLKGTGKAWIAPFFEIGGVSLAAALMMAVVSAVVGYGASSPSVLMLFTVAMSVLCFFALACVAYDKSKIKKSIPSLFTESSFRAEISQGQLAFTIIAFSGFLIQAGSFAIVGPFISENALGLARAAERLALIISFPVLAINPFIAARIVHYSQARQSAALKQLMVRASLVGGIIVAPILVVMLWAPEMLLHYMGADFIEAATYLRFLALSNFVLVLLGPFAMVMNMHGGERPMMWLSVVTLIAAIILYPLMAIIWGTGGFIAAYIGISAVRAVITSVLATNAINQISAG